MFSVFAQSYINTRRCWENSKQLYVTTANSPNPQVCMLWCNFILGSNFIFLCFKLIFIYCHTPKQRKTKFKPRKKFNHKTYTFKISRHTPVNSKPMSNSCFHDQLTSQLFTYSHANTPLGESESVHCLSYFMKLYCIYQWCYFHGMHMSVCLFFFFNQNFARKYLRQKVLDHFNTKATVCTSPTLEAQLCCNLKTNIFKQFIEHLFNIYFTSSKGHHQHHKVVIRKYFCFTTATLFLKSWLNNATMQYLEFYLN